MVVLHNSPQSGMPQQHRPACHGLSVARRRDSFATSIHECHATEPSTACSHATATVSHDDDATTATTNGNDASATTHDAAAATTTSSICQQQQQQKNDAKLKDDAAYNTEDDVQTEHASNTERTVEDWHEGLEEEADAVQGHEGWTQGATMEELAAAWAQAEAEYEEYVVDNCENVLLIVSCKMLTLVIAVFSHSSVNLGAVISAARGCFDCIPI